MDLEKARGQDELLFAAVGRLVVTWAHLEFGLDSMILVIHRLMDGAKHERRLPRMLKDKIRYLKNAFDRLGIAEADKPRYDAFLDEVEQAGERRHDIIHGFPIHHPSDEGEARLVRLLIRGDTWQNKHVTITIASVNEGQQEAHRLASKASHWARTMVSAYEAHQRGEGDLNQPGRP